MKKLLQIKSLIFVIGISFSFNQETWIPVIVGEYENEDCTGELMLYPEDEFACSFQITLNDDFTGSVSECSDGVLEIDQEFTVSIDTIYHNILDYGYDNG